MNEKKEQRTHEQTIALSGAEQSQHALLVAQDHLYRALRRPQPGRERRWAEEVLNEVEAALGAIQNHREEVTGAGGVYNELQREAPWVIARTRQMIAQLGRIEAEAVDLKIELARIVAGDTQAISGIRAEVERILLSLRDVLSKEVDLIYERFNEPGALD